MSPVDDFFRGRLDQVTDLRHPLALVVSRMPWHEIEASLAYQFTRKLKAGKQVEGSGWFGPEVNAVGGSNPAPENIIGRDFQSEKPKQKWLNDLIEFSISAGKVYLVPMIDCFDSLVVSSTISL